MQSLYYKLVSGGSYVSLMDVTKGDAIENWEPDATMVPQRENLAVNVGTLNNTYRQPLGNLTTKISIKLSTVSADETTAAAFAATTQAALLGNKCHYRAVFGATTSFYPNGICTRCKPRYLGSTIEFTIELETDVVTATPV